jgi:integrase
MQEPIRRGARDPAVVRATAGLVAYLRELVLSTRGPVRDCAHYETQVWLADLPEGVDRPSATPDGVLLTLDHVPPLAPPALPESLKGWVEPNASSDPTGPDPPLAEEGPGEIIVTDENGRTGLVQGTVQRQEAADVLRAYTTWLVLWRRWADEERAARPRRNLYEQLAPIVRKLAQQDDSYELVLGVGLLTWATSKDERVFRHLITTRVSIVIDRVTARLTVALLAVHRCLHRALAQAVTWQLIAHNPAAHATPPPVPRTEAVALAPEQVAVLLDAAGNSSSPWLGTWTILAAATGARNGEVCGLEWADLDLDAATVQFRQALTIIDPTVLSDDADGDSSARGGGVRKELAVGPLKSTASNAILTLPPFAVQALRHHGRQQHRLRLALGQPATLWLRWVEPGEPPRPVELDLVFRTERDTPVNPNHASRAFARLAASVGLAAHPHLPRHALASAMAANKEPASIIAAQLRHADGGALAQRVYIHQLPQTAPRLAGVIEGVFGPGARDGRAVSAGRRLEGKWRETRPSDPT